ncbi:uncharacterized protein LOC129770528 [Toxorhynchites rutilus septentrionalis]|uniref:uncharacterized protein LOC129770528 n=1 Tax=Toxorhynchites rutilus septentrionalis TaxID=329112 RepID=UPI002478F7A9|nr:uncharacterized protein LOC129770528 [Toxorhynchites rutilus septentrionalis]
MKYLENLLIYFSNLSTFYIFSVAISVAVVVLTIYLGAATQCTNGTVDTDSKSQILNDSDFGDDNFTDDSPKIESVRQLKSAKLKSFEKTLTAEQIEAEKEIERKQLAAIFELLKKQNEEFSLEPSLDENGLKEQLSLYR